MSEENKPRTLSLKPVPKRRVDPLAGPDRYPARARGESVPATEFDTLLAEEDPELYIWLADAPDDYPELLAPLPTAVPPMARPCAATMASLTARRA